MILIRFVTTEGDVVSDGIRAMEYGFWATHAEALMPDGKLLGAHADGGVQARPHDYDKDKFTREMYVHIPAVTPQQTDDFHSFLRAQIGKPYDRKAIAAFVASTFSATQRDWRSDNSWFCSELIVAAMCHCGIFPKHLADEFNHITPRDLLLIVSGRYELEA